MIVMAQSREYKAQIGYVLPEIDHRMAIWQAYMNCQNAFLGISMMGASESGASLNISRTPQETFVYCLGVLDAYLQHDKDQEFLDSGPTNIPELLDANPPNEFGRFDKFSDYLRYWSRAESLMIRCGFYNVQRTSVHL